MSTDYAFLCLSHTPPLLSETLAHEPEALLAILHARSSGVDYSELRTYYHGGAGWDTTSWLENHPHCFVQVATEYGDPRGPVCPPERYV